MSDVENDPYIYGDQYESPSQVVHETPSKQQQYYPGAKSSGKQLLPYEISPEELSDLQDGGNRVKRMRGMIGRVFGAGATAALR